jgi:hypothetical protein
MGIVMSYTVDDYVRDYTKEHLHTLTPQERLAGLPSEEIWQQFSPDQRLQGLSPSIIEAYLTRLKKRSP